MNFILYSVIVVVGTPNLDLHSIIRFIYHVVPLNMFTDTDISPYIAIHTLLAPSTPPIQSDHPLPAETRGSKKRSV